jgi:hypothetical protein
VEVFKYLRRLLVQDDDNIQAICNQLWEAQAPWARVGFYRQRMPYKAAVQVMLIYISKT